MLGKNLSEALSDISDDKIEAAANYAPKGRRQLWVRVAACAAVLSILLTMFFWPGEVKVENGQIVAAPGILRAYAYEVKDEKDTDFSKLEEYEFVVNQIKPGKNMWFPISNYELAITPVVDEAYLEEFDVTFEVSTQHGALVYNYHNREKYTSYAEAVAGKYAVVANGETLYWEGFELYANGEAGKMVGKDTIIYVDLIIKANEHIVGYAIFEIVALGGAYEGNARTGKLVSTVSFPMVDGCFQDVTKEYVLEEIAKFKSK